MSSDTLMHLNLCSQVLTRGEDGRSRWESVFSPTPFTVQRTAVLLCDVWDKHWCRGATERLDAMVPRMNEVVETARHAGISVIHAPSGTMDYYAETPARKRVLAAPSVGPPAPAEHADPPLPVDASDEGSDTGEPKSFKAWATQHPGITIDQQKDAISDDGREVYSFMQSKGIDSLVIMGVHTNMCVLGRSFGIKQMVRWGVNVVLVRDLTDVMYNPAMPPYVSHEEGTRLVVEYIEKFWCATVTSAELLVALETGRLPAEPRSHS